MYLKQLDITGFKSFADRTRLTFEPGIIAIVGPNGCGKTNIVDSVRWVLGEQSAKSMRGKKMEEVIFHGASERKGLGFAEVSLTIDNSKGIMPIEFSEVTITRRVFRSGEGQYFINKNLCRLKDIEQLFMDTGVGTSAYSVLEQGKMDLILSSKPEDRRFVFEEAAGITKYKEQKRETMQKLENTENNLVRINDIAKEVERQISSIERQAAKARRYKKIQDELKELEVKNYAYQLKNLKDTSLLYEQEKTSVESQSAQMAGVIERKEQRLIELRDSLQQILSAGDKLQNEKVMVESELAGGRHQLEFKKEKKDALKSRNMEIETELEKIAGDIEEITNALIAAESELKEAAQKKSEQGGKLNDKQAELDRYNNELRMLKEKEHSCRNDFIDRSACESRLKNELSQIDVELKTLILKERRDSVELNRKKKASENSALNIMKTEEVMKAQKESLEKLKQSLKDREEKVMLLKEKSLSIESDLKRAHNLMNEKRSQYEILSSQKKVYEGYSDTVREILQKKDELPGVKGTVADFVNVPKNYSIAIEAVLANRAKWLVVDTEENMDQILGMIDIQNKSQVTFVVLNKLIETGMFDRGGLKIEGNSVFAMDIIKQEEPFDKLMRFLLGNVVITENIEQAKNLLKTTAVPVKAVTLKGIVLDSNGIVRMGNSEEKLGLICRDSIINELKVDLEDVSGVLFNLNQKKRIIEDRAKQEEGYLEGAKNNLYSEEVTLGILENDFMKQKMSFEEANDELQTLQYELDDTIRSIEEYKNRRGEKEDLLKDESSGVHSADQMLKEISFSAEKIERERDKEERIFTELKISLIGAEERENHLVFKADQLKYQMDSAKNLQNKDAEEKGNNIRLIAQLEDEISGLELKISNLSGRSAEVEKAYSANQAFRSDLEKEMTALENSLKDERTTKDKVGQELNERQFKLAEIGLKINNIMQKLQEQYRIGQTEIESVQLDNIISEELENQILILREKLDSMGQVSLVAIEEYEALQQRFEFLNAQRQDLIGAKDSLLKAIVKINSTTKKIFMDTFQEIKVHFNEIFCRFFNGGKADLLLLDESDVLECGIEIIARPPGKKLQNVSLLSGGEKALTAISLLFAMFKVKPSPFCILDEIDAPLDDSNIDRFLRILKEFSETSQFMVVTHNKRTIGAAEALYGITMEESGVSKVVSVKIPEKAAV